MSSAAIQAQEPRKDDRARPAGRGAPGRRRVSRPEREATMISAATQIFGRRGYAETSMDDIASAAGITKPMLYSYFGSKAGLFAACALQAEEGLEARVRAVGEDASLGLEERLWHGLLAVFEFVDTHREGWAVLYPSGAEPAGAIGVAAAQARRSMEALVAGLFADAARTRGFGDQAVEHMPALATGFAAATIASASAWLAQPSEPREVAALRLMNLVWVGFAGMLRGELWLPGEA